MSETNVNPPGRADSATDDGEWMLINAYNAALRSYRNSHGMNTGESEDIEGDEVDNRLAKVEDLDGRPEESAGHSLSRERSGTRDMVVVMILLHFFFCFVALITLTKIEKAGCMSPTVQGESSRAHPAFTLCTDAFMHRQLRQSLHYA